MKYNQRREVDVSAMLGHVLFVCPNI